MSHYRNHRRRHHARSPGRLYRDPDRGKIFGVCAGVADYFGVEVWPVRLAAVVSLIFFTLPTVIAYLLASWLVQEKPDDLYARPEQEDIWRTIRTGPGQTLRDIRHRFRELERRLRAMEAHVTSREFKLNREINDLDS